MADIVPYGISTDALPLEDDAPTSENIEGVMITCDERNLETLVATLRRWFAKRSYVKIVDYGYTDKVSNGYILIEWVFHEIDQLFLDILESEDIVEDYATYVRDVEEGQR